MSNEWALVDRLIAERDRLAQEVHVLRDSEAAAILYAETQRDRLAEALRDLADASDAYDRSPVAEVVTRRFNAKRKARAVLAECAGTPTEDGDDAPSDLFPCGSCGTAFTGCVPGLCDECAGAPTEHLDGFVPLDDDDYASQQAALEALDAPNNEDAL